MEQLRHGEVKCLDLDCIALVDLGVQVSPQCLGFGILRVLHEAGTGLSLLYPKVSDNLSRERRDGGLLG